MGRQLKVRQVRVLGTPRQTEDRAVVIVEVISTISIRAVDGDPVEVSTLGLSLGEDVLQVDEEQVAEVGGEVLVGDGFEFADRDVEEDDDLPDSDEPTDFGTLEEASG